MLPEQRRSGHGIFMSQNHSKLKSNLPGKMPNTLDDKNIIHENYWNRQNSYHDTHAKDLTPLKPDYIRYQEMDTRCG